jgi:hypothetical protein
MATKRGPSDPPAGKGQPVEVFSVQPGSPAFYRFLGDLIGLNTHWNGKRTVPCDGEGRCPSGLHRTRLIFKAYAPAELWVPAAKHWIPGVMEATEHLEELLRGRPLRGEVWLLSRAGQGRKNDPVAGVYCETFNGDALRLAFDILPVLLRFYHVRELVLGVENTLPPKILLEASVGNAPTLPFSLEPTAPPAATQEQIEQIRAMAGQLGKRFSSTSSTSSGTSTSPGSRATPEPSKNGKHS